MLIFAPFPGTLVPQPPHRGREGSVLLPMKKLSYAILGGALAAALALTACGGTNAGSGTGSGSMGMSESAGSGGAQNSQSGGNAAWRTGLGILTEASGSADTGKVNTITAVVVLDGEGKVADVTLDEMELSLSADSSGGITLPSDLRTKRQKGSSYPLAAVSSLEKGWAEQADAFGRWLTGKTPDEVRDVRTDEDGRPADADLLSGCTIAVDGYRDAILLACENAKAAG